MLSAGAAVLLFAGATVMLSHKSIMSMSGGGAQRRLQGSTVPLRRLAYADYGQVGDDQTSNPEVYCAAPNDASVITTHESSPNVYDCAEKCDTNWALNPISGTGCVSFEYDDTAKTCTLYKDYDRTKVDPMNDHTCWVRMGSFTDETYISVLGDPLFTGFQGQVLKFEGRDSGWYANLASPSLQWNLNFHKFDQCPAGEDMFVTSSSINLLKEDGPADSILVTLDAAPTQEDGLANGVLSIVVGEQTIDTPGDYRFDDSGIRVVVHNTYGACSRKWYDYDKSIEAAATEQKIVEGAAASQSHRRLRVAEEPSPLDLLRKSQGKMLNPEECDAWISERDTNGDLFDQRGGWATIYIMTPLVSYHLEVRQSDPKTSPCTYQSLDTWISHITDELRAEEWRGIIGETRTSKEDENGNPIMHDRSAILDYPEDEAYEVDGPFGTSFLAKVAVSTSVKLK